MTCGTGPGSVQFFQFKGTSLRVRRKEMVDPLDSADGSCVGFEDTGRLGAEVAVPAPRGIQLVRTKVAAEAARYQLVNGTSRPYPLHLPTLLIAPVTDAGVPEPVAK